MHFINKLMDKQGTIKKICHLDVDDMLEFGNQVGQNLRSLVKADRSYRHVDCIEDAIFITKETYRRMLNVDDVELPRC